MPVRRHEGLADLAVIGVDIGKDTFHLVGFDCSGERVLRLKIRRLALPQVFEKLPRCVVGMEACLSAQFVSRTLRRLGFEPRIIPAIYVKPFSCCRSRPATGTHPKGSRHDPVQNPRPHRTGGGSLAALLRLAGLERAARAAVRGRHRSL
jgi:hypothetical protein